MPKRISDEAILEKAMEVIIEQGYTGATTKQIAAAAGINELTLFRRFENKKNLVLAAARREVEEFADEEIRYTGNVEADLRDVVAYYQDAFGKRSRLITVLLAEAPRQPELYEAIQTALGVFSKVITMVERYQEEGLLLKAPPFHVAVALLGPIMATAFIGGLQSNSVSSQPDSDDFVRRFLDGYGIE
ncbi:TetR/AcrR family transcriptional regulator [Chloroflexi bacterium TSY]|nr:TetR/AcrR family transcriptional regulator [Chloroflexi bacterium TSY]